MMTGEPFNPFTEQEVMEYEALAQRLWENDYWGISLHDREILIEFVTHVARDFFDGAGLVQAWMLAIKVCISVDYPKAVFPTTQGGLALFPQVLEIMDLELDVKRAALAIYEVVDPAYRQLALF